MEFPMDIDSVEREVVEGPLQRPIIRSSSLSAPDAPFHRPQTRQNTGYVYDPDMMAHTHPTEDHPEQPDRISIIFREMRQQSLHTRMKSLFFGPVVRHHAMLVHSEDHWDKVEHIARKSQLLYLCHLH